MRIMALDIGDKYIGVAVSDPLCITAGGLTTLQRQSLKKDLQKVSELVDEYEVSKVVAGLPLNMQGTKGQSAQKVEGFVRRLKGKLRVPIVYWDERLSTMTAEKVLIEGNVRRNKRKSVIDKMAAAIILQNYLDSL